MRTFPDIILPDVLPSFDALSTYQSEFKYKKNSPSLAKLVDTKRPSAAPADDVALAEFDRLCDDGSVMSLVCHGF